jgi:hypothetical protein
MNTNTNISTISSSVSSLLEIVLCRESWSLQQIPTGVEIIGRTGSGREISATVIGARLPRGATRLVGGVLGWDCDPAAHEEEARRVSAARWLCRAFRGANVSVTLTWEEGRSPYSSSFGIECLAALGHRHAQSFLDLEREHYWNHPLIEAEMARFAALHAPLPEGEEDGDAHPFFAPMWAA